MASVIAGPSPVAAPWAGSGESTRADPFAAGAQAAAAAVAGREAELVLVFATERLVGGELLAGLRAGAGPGVAAHRIVGCSVEAAFAANVVTDGVVALALGGPGVGAGAGLVAGGGGPRGVGRRLGGELRGLEAPGGASLALVLSAALAGDQSEVVRGLYGVLGGGVPLAGGCTGGFPVATTTRQFLGDRLVCDGAAGAVLRSRRPVGIGVAHGYHRTGRPMTVTRSDGALVLELDGRPALDAYLEALDAPEEAHRDEQAFHRFALSRPLVLNRRGGPLQARCISGCSYVGRALQCVAEVPQSGTVWAAATDVASTLQAAEAACVDALAPLGGRPPRALLVFDCIGRMGVLGDAGTAESLRIFRRFAAGAPVAGFYTLGEIARTSGVSGFHNKAVVVVAFG